MTPRDESHTYSPDELFDALSHVYRRCVLYVMREFGSMEFDELVDVVTGWLHTQDGESASPSDRRRVATALYHVHLPKLAEYHLVEFADPDGPVTPTIGDGELDTLLDWFRSHESPTPVDVERGRGA